MYPMYGHMDSYPHQRPYAPYYQNLERTPYPMKPDLPKAPSPYENYPYGLNTYYHPHPMEFYSCCNHKYIPNCYDFRPPYPHFPPPQPFHFHGNYAPHPHYPIDMPPRYDYDKNTPRDHHCCGCANHTCTGKENRIVKMEEPDPDSEKKTTDLLGNYQYPVVWIPPGFLKKEEEKEKSAEVDSKGEEGNENSKHDEGIRFLNGWLPRDMNKLESLTQSGDKKMPSKISITPVKTGGNEDSDSVQMIPKEMERLNDKGTKEKPRNIPAVFRTDVGETKVTKYSEKGPSSSSSPQKSSKLPPVCLRVDPLPGKKRSSRSPSPTNKGKSEIPASENLEVQGKSMEKESKNGKCVSEESTQCKNVNLAQSEEKCEVGEKKVESVKEESIPVTNVLCDDEAAVKIQSVYRGYEVRKWDPLNKLKQLAEVKEQMAEIIRNIEALAASSADEKHRLVTGETIMNLLLKLDTIQGFHPSIRDVRKSVARQLVSLQEKLDTLITKNPVEDLSTSTVTSIAETVEPLMVQDVNVEEQVDHGGALESESVQDIYGKSVDSTVLEDVVLTEEPVPVGEENDKKVLEQLKKLSDAQLEVQEKEVNQVVEGLSVLRDEATESDEVLPPLKTEEPKSEIPITREETAGEVPKETNAESDVQLEETNGIVCESIVSERDAIEGDNAVLPSRTEEPEIEISFSCEKNDEKYLEEIKVKCDVQLEETIGNVDKFSILNGEATNADEGVEPLKTEELEIMIPLIGQENDGKVHEETKADFVVQLEEINGEVNETSVSEGVATKTEEVPLFSNAAEPNIEFPDIREGDVVEVLEETKGEADVEPEEAEEKGFGHSDEEGCGKTEKVEMQAVEENLMEKQQVEREFRHGEVFEEKLREENEKLREMVEKLVEAGKEQVCAISNLTGKVRDLEKKLSKKNKLKARRKLRTFNQQMV